MPPLPSKLRNRGWAFLLLMQAGDMSKRKKRNAGRHLKSQYPRFNEATDSYEALLRTAYRIEKQKRKSLRGVYEVERTETSKGADLLSRLGHKGYTQHLWDIEEDDGYTNLGTHGEGGSLGGFTNWIVDRHNRIHTIIVMYKIDSLVDEPEVGHVDDYEKGINFTPKKITNIGKAEEYAHHFACRQCIRRGLHVPLGLYLRGVDSKLAKSDVESVRRAAVAVRESNEYQEYRDFAGTFYDDFAGTFDDD